MLMPTASPDIVSHERTTEDGSDSWGPTRTVRGKVELARPLTDIEGPDLEAVCADIRPDPLPAGMRAETLDVVASPDYTSIEYTCVAMAAAS